MHRLARVATYMFTCGVLVGLSALHGGCSEAEQRSVPEGEYERIVSLAPSITELLFALGVGDRVVGATRYCNYPPEARDLPRLGGYLDPNYEAMLRLQPDLVVTVEEHVDAQERLGAFGIATARVNHKTIPGIIASMRSLGEVCGVPARGDSLASAIERRVDEITAATEGKERPSVLLAVGRNLGSADLEDVYVAAEDGFYSDLIRMAGGRNAYPGGPIRFPVVSEEGIMRLNPDIIIDLVADLDEHGLEAEAVRSQWGSLNGVRAVERGDVYVLTGDYVVIPGPRFPLLLEDLVRIIHPELAEDASTEGVD